jgi:RIO kinase 2
MSPYFFFVCIDVLQIDDDEKVTMIDFPQMVSVKHRNAQMFFDRDIECIYKFFRKRLLSI